MVLSMVNQSERWGQWRLRVEICYFQELDSLYGFQVKMSKYLREQDQLCNREPGFASNDEFLGCTIKQTLRLMLCCGIGIDQAAKQAMGLVACMFPLRSIDFLYKLDRH